MGEIYETPDAYRADPIRISDDIWYVGNTSVSCHLIDTGDGLILIDSSYPQTVNMLIESIRATGNDPADLRIILHTHAHYDHIGGTRALVERYGCRTFLGREDAPLLGERHDLNWHLEYGLPFEEGFTPDVLLSDGDTVRLGHTEIRCIASPGHTLGNMTFLWNTTWQERSYTVVLSGGWYPSTANPAYLRHYGLEDRDAFYRSTFRRLADLQVDIMLGSHPVFNDTFGKAARFGEGVNPFIDPEEWQKALAAGSEEYCRLISQQS